MDALEQEIQSLRQEVALLNQHRFVRVQNNWAALVGFQFVRGLAFGLGSVMGATILVSILVYVLSFADFVPVIGEWAAEIIQVIERTN